MRLLLAYDGTAYHGWQSQPDGLTVQDRVLAAAQRVLGAGVRVTGASRTDAGVHALGQVASLATDRALAPEALARALNALLPDDVRVLAAREAAPGWSARRSATGKRYLYLIDNAPVASPLLRRWAWHVPGALDVAAMRRGLAALRGAHDFSAFCAAPGLDTTPGCTLRSAHVVRRRHRVAVLLGADRFLHHMVRNLVGSAVLVGRGRRPPGWLPEVLASRDRRRAGPTAPAHGLTLVRVTYPR
ncbi:MAG: tRNA pseudouridine(38-40) synthase TruA [Candidatus Rokubacteria bacterium]|nr:tRNA pseudouridine(38-40) synthase TruA [Candidatus Rokubacteria bacterium]MBI3824993.1 tRNA pseudouridine(38-40) synthase TruA [Candidatus Rokubacteria bacterium]